MTTTGTATAALHTALRVAVGTLEEPHLDKLLRSADPATVAAFGPGSTVEPVDVGSNLWAVVRADHDRIGAVLCVHNVSDRPCSFAPDPLLPARPGVGSSLRFLLGEVRTEPMSTGLLCHVGPRSFVWISRVSEADTP